MSGDPKRLFEDPTTSASVRDDLVRSMAAPQPEYEMERGMARLVAVTAAGSAAGTAASSVKAATVASSTKAAWIAGLVKWGLWGGAAVVATGASAHFLLASHRGDSTSAVAGAQPTVAAAPVATGDSPSRSASLIVATASPSVDTPPSAVSRAPVPRPPGHSGLARPHEQTDPQATGEQTTDESVAREVALLGRARAALASDPAQALALTQEGQRDFPRGVLGEEREAIAVLALLRLGRRTEGAARGQAFVTRYPDGPFTERVRLALGPSNGPPR
jgi:hypothetical protein